MPKSDHQEQLDRSRAIQAGLVAGRHLTRLQRRAGKAAADPEIVHAQLVEACDVFASGDWGDLSVSEIAQVGRRIARLGSMLDAADQLPAARDGMVKAQARLDRLPRLPRTVRKGAGASG